MCFPVPGIRLDTKWILIISWMDKGKEFLFFTYPSCKKKQVVSSSGLRSLMNFPSHRRLCLCQRSFSRMHISLAEAQLPLSCSKGQVSRGAPAIRPQPTLILMQFLFAFFWSASLALSLYRNATLWHLMNKITPWPEYCFGKEMTQKTPNLPWTCIFLVGHHSRTCQSLALCCLLTWRVSAMRGAR